MLRRRRRPIVARVEMGRGPSGLYYHRLKAHNGETIAAAETYTSKADCYGTALPLAAQLGVKLVRLDPLEPHHRR